MICLFAAIAAINGKGLAIMERGISKTMQLQGELVAKILKENGGKLPKPTLSLGESVKSHAEKSKKWRPLEELSTGVDD